MNENKSKIGFAKPNIKTITFTGLCSALLCILSPISIPIGPVPVSLSVLAVALCAYIPIESGALWPIVIYILLGFVGLPVFSGYSGGAAKLSGKLLADPWEGTAPLIC